MRCDEVQERIEALAIEDAGDAQLLAHLETCAACAAALARARQLDAALRAAPTAVVPASFTSAVLNRTRSIQWQEEQRLDWWFNAVIAVSLAIVAAGVWGAAHVTGLSAVTVETVDFLRLSLPALFERARPELQLYGSAAGLVFASLGLWWWLERAGRPGQTA